MKSIYVYGDDSNHTLCIRGDIQETYWANTACDEEPASDVMAFSDGTVLEFYHEEGDPLFRLRVVSPGSAFQGVEKQEGLSDEAALEGEISWVVVGNVTEILRFSEPAPERPSSLAAQGRS